MRNIETFPKIIWGLFGIGLLLRIIGIWYGLPLQLNIDEPTLVSSSLHLRYNLNPEHFVWPHLYFYINAFFYLLFVIVRKGIEYFLALPEMFHTAVPFFLISRLLSATFGALTIVVIYFLSAKMFSKKVGIIAAAILTILPVHVYEAHFGKIDVAHTFFSALAIYYIYKIYLTGFKKYYILSGIFIGLTTSIKYNGALLFFPLVLAILLKENNWRNYINIQNTKNLFISISLAIGSFYLGTPFALLDYDRFFSTKRGVGALWQFKNVGKVSWAEYPIELYNTFIVMYQGNLGLFLWIIFILLFVLFLFFNKRDKKYVFLLLPTLVFSFYISKLGRSPNHYFMFLIPLYVPALAKFIHELWLYLKRKYKLPVRSLYVFVGIILLPSFVMVMQSDFLLSKKDTRNFAYNWIRENLNDNDYLYVHGEELKSMPFKKNETEKIKKVDRSNIRRQGPFYVIIGVEGVTKESISTGKRDPENLNGNSEPILKNADLVFYADDTWRLGPPIYVFRINYIEKDD